jgi:hypothetical protein
MVGYAAVYCVLAVRESQYDFQFKSFACYA